MPMTIVPGVGEADPGMNTEGRTAVQRFPSHASSVPPATRSTVNRTAEPSGSRAAVA
jgi:hypothetical protein